MKKMTNVVPESTVDRANTQGLEDLLDSSLDNNPDQGQTLLDDWSLEETAEYLGLSIKTVRRRLRDGKLSGYKITGPNGPEWRIKQTTIDNDHTQERPGSNNLSIVQGELVSALDNTVDINLVKELMTKLESLTYRNGYLEAQLQEREKEIKLLTDSQNKPRWLERVWSKFKK